MSRSFHEMPPPGAEHAEVDQHWHAKLSDRLPEGVQVAIVDPPLERGCQDFETFQSEYVGCAPHFVRGPGLERVVVSEADKPRGVARDRAGQGVSLPPPVANLTRSMP